MKHLLLILLCLAASLRVAAQGITIRQTDGSVVYFAFDDHPKMTFEGGNIVVTCKGVSVELTPTQVKLAEFDDKAPVVDAILSPAEAGEGLESRNGTVSVTSAEPGSAVSVYGIDGILLQTHTVDASGSVSFSLRALPKGVFIIKTSTSSYKLKNS